MTAHPLFLGLSSSFRNARPFREGSMQVRQCAVHDVGSSLSETRKPFLGLILPDDAPPCAQRRRLSLGPVAMESMLVRSWIIIMWQSDNDQKRERLSADQRGRTHLDTPQSFATDSVTRLVMHSLELPGFPSQSSLATPGHGAR